MKKRVRKVSEDNRIRIDEDINPLSVNRMWDVMYDAVDIYAADTEEELIEVLKNGQAQLIDDIHPDSLRKLGDIEMVNEKIVYWICGSLISDTYKNIRRRGRKSNNIKGFFNKVTNVPIDPDELQERYGCYLSPNVIKQHKRYDTYPERGLTKIKNGMIFRLPKEE